MKAKVSIEFNLDNEQDEMVLYAELDEKSNTVRFPKGSVAYGIILTYLDKIVKIGMIGKLFNILDSWKNN